MTNPKHIAILCNYELLPERVGGMDYFFWQFDAKCKANHIQVDWFFPNQSAQGSYSNLTIYASENETVESHFLNFCKQNETDYSHVITHFLELCTPFFKEAKQVSNTKIIAVDHNPRPLNGYPFGKRIKKKIKGLLYAQYIDTFIGVSEYSKKELIKDFGPQIKNKIQVIHNGIDIDAIQVRTERSTSYPSFLAASHLRESKGVQDLIQAVSLLPETIKEELVVDVYGDGPYKLQLQNLVKSLALGNCFNFKGSTSNLKATYCKYDYLIHPSYEETFCYTVIEALAANTKVITTNEGGNVLGIITHLDNGLLFEAKHPAQLSSIIKKIWNRELKISKTTREYVEERFSLERMVDNHFGLLF